MADLRPYPGAPRWVKVFGVIVAVGVLLFIVLHLTGFFPGGHMSSHHVA